MSKEKLTLYQILIELSDSHCRFKSDDKSKRGYADLLRFDLDEKSIFNGKLVLMERGNIKVDQLKLADDTVYNLNDIDLIGEKDLVNYNIASIKDNPYEVIEKLYSQYKTSVPSEHSQFSRQNFKALKADNLSLEQLINNMKRIKAQYMLEGYILMASLKGWIPWSDDKHFYWKSENDRELILYKSWIKG